MKLKVGERTLAEKLRRQGKSYTEIAQVVPVSRASLSLWLRNINLTSKQRNRLTKLSLAGQVAGAKARRDQRLVQLDKLKKEVAVELPHLLHDEFFTLGLALYWAEGTKQKPWNISQQVRFSNSDEKLILLISQWFQQFAGIGREDIKYSLYIHKAADAKVALTRWAKILDVALNQIPIILKHHDVVGRHPHNDYKGLIQVRVRKSAWLNRRIELWVQGAAHHFLK